MMGVYDHIIKAALLHEQGHLDQAISLLEKAKALDPQKPEVHFNLGLYWGLLGNPLQASVCFAEAVRFRPEWIDAHVYMIAYTIQAGEIEKALKQLDEAFKLSPDDKMLHEQFAIAMERKLMLERASGRTEELEQALGYLQSAVGHLKTISSKSEMSGNPTKVRQYIEKLSLVRGAISFADSSLAREVGMAFNLSPPAASGHDFPGFIILTTMPKSGSEYVWMALTTGLNLMPIRISSAHIHEVIDKERIELVSKGGFVSHGHIHCTGINSVLLSNYTDRLVVHVRDPRQALISWIHYQNHRDVKSLPSRKPWGRTTEERFKTQIKHFINSFYSDQLKFLRSWMDAEHDKDFSPRILFTRQEDLREDPQGFFHRILDFFSIRKELFQFPEPPKGGERHFRRGESDEWRKVLLPQHIDLMQEMLPDDMLERFEWKR